VESGRCAKQIATIDHISNGRIGFNVVSGWFKGEFTAIGEHWLEHDERYRRSREFIEALKGIWTQDNFTYKGDFYRFKQLHAESEADSEAASGDLPGRQFARRSRQCGKRLRLVLHERQTRPRTSSCRSTTSRRRPRGTITR